MGSYWSEYKHVSYDFIDYLKKKKKIISQYENGQATYTRVLKMLDTFSVPQESCVRVYPEVLYSRDMCTFKDEGQGACFVRQVIIN